jgi:hypothetical protein
VEGLLEHGLAGNINLKVVIAICLHYCVLCCWSLYQLDFGTLQCLSCLLPTLGPLSSLVLRMMPCSPSSYELYVGACISLSLGMAFWGTTQNDDAVYRHRSMGMLAVLSKAFPWGMGMRFRTAIAMLAVLSVNEWLVVWVQTTKLGESTDVLFRLLSSS